MRLMGGMHAAQPDLHTPYSPGLCCLYRCLAVVEEGQVLKLAIRIMNHGAVCVLSLSLSLSLTHTQTHSHAHSLNVPVCTHTLNAHAQEHTPGACGMDQTTHFRVQGISHPPATLPPPPCCFSLFLNIPFAVLMKTVRDFYSSCLLHK